MLILVATRRVARISQLFLEAWNQAQRHGGSSGAVPPQITACTPPNENCAPPSEDCAMKKFTDSGLLECKSRPKTPKMVFTGYRSYFRNFCGLTPDFRKLLGRKPFFIGLHFIDFIFIDLFYWFLLEFCGKSQEFWDDNQNLWKFMNW